MSVFSKLIVRPVGMAVCALWAYAPDAVAQPVTAATTALVDVNVITLLDDRIYEGYTVLVRGDRIVRVGPAKDVEVPSDALRIDAAGAYLLPGLVDAHVHLTSSPWAPTRPDFGDAVLYLTHGVTSVINLYGTAEQLDWRRRVESGDITGPTIYTSGDFVNEPRVTTPDEIEQDVCAQARAGYDLIKFHEIWTPDRGYVTTTGLSREAYLRMIETARREGLPIVGHAPANLGFETVVEGRQALAHVGVLATAYFSPVLLHLRSLSLAAVAFVVLFTVVVLTVARSAARRFGWREGSSSWSRARVFAGLVLLSTLAAVACAVLFLPGGPGFDSRALRVVFAIAATTIAACATLLLADGIVRWNRSTMAERAEVLLLSTSAVVLTVWAITWASIGWRSSAGGINRLADRLRSADIAVQTTLVVYEAGTRTGADRLMRDPVIELLSPATRAVWRRMHADAADQIPANYLTAMQKVTKALHTRGVSIIAGTDAMGMPFLSPGASLIRELELLVASGISPGDALRAATIRPAEFLGKADEFGTLTIGKRADLLLVPMNPLDDVTIVRRAIGVMVRGQWLPRLNLEAALETLAHP